MTSQARRPRPASAFAARPSWPKRQSRRCGGSAVGWAERSDACHLRRGSRTMSTGPSGRGARPNGVSLYPAPMVGPRKLGATYLACSRAPRPSGERGWGEGRKLREPVEAFVAPLSSLRPDARPGPSLCLRQQVSAGCGPCYPIRIDGFRTIAEALERQSGSPRSPQRQRGRGYSGVYLVGRRRQSTTPRHGLTRGSNDRQATSMQASAKHFGAS